MDQPYKGILHLGKLLSSAEYTLKEDISQMKSQIPIQTTL